MVKYFCDICGKNVQTSSMLNTLFIKSNDTNKKQIMEVCDDCKTNILNHINTLSTKESEGNNER